MDGRDEWEGNDRIDGSGRRRAVLRRAAVLAAAAGISVLIAACGGSSSSSGASGSSPYAEALSYAQCMRSNGEPTWPDPDSQGQFEINAQSMHIDVGSTLYASANRSCQHLYPGGIHSGLNLTAQQQQSLLSQGLKFVACMRTHGVPDMPDPRVSSHGFGFPAPADLSPNSPQYKSAQQACQSLEPKPAGS